MERISRDDLIRSFMNFYADTGPPEKTPAAFAAHEFYLEPEADSEMQARLRRFEKLRQEVDARTLDTQAQPLAKDLKLDYADALNPRQLVAATTTAGPLLILAGAGSGKTRTLIYRLSYLLETGVAPERILLLTFTRKSSAEMLLRARMLLQSERAEKVMGGTFHSFASYLLRRYAKLLDLDPQFSIIDTVDSEDIIDLIRQELKFDKKSRAFPKKSRIQELISRSRNCQMTLAEVIGRDFTGLEDYLEELQTLADVYAEYKRRHSLLDYDDLLIQVDESLKHHPAFKRSVQNLYDHVMVDEYQDTNRVQKSLADQICERHQNLMVVGDDAQSIYGFRGAELENILLFPESWPQCRIVRLEQNYRSSQPLLDFSNELLKQAKLGYPKKLFSERKDGIQPVISKHFSTEDEAIWVVDRILELREQGLNLNDIAVLYRSGFHSNYIQTELLRRSIPYIVYGGIRFIERRHVKDLVALARLLLNPLDAIAWHRVLKLIPGVGQVTARKIIEGIRQHQGQFVLNGMSNKKFAPALQELQRTLEQCRQATSVSEQLGQLQNYYTPLLKQVESDWQQRSPDLDILQQLGQKYKKLETFLSDFALDPPSQKFQNGTTPLIDESEERPVVLSTVHSAKGLEWQAVFVPHLLDGLLPSARSLKRLDDLEEERRLFYVACTRAKEYLFLSYPAWHQSYDAVFTQVSRFIQVFANP
jgi:DNA helicase II / ATP-dependent DNA helicase PcrA